MDEQIRTVWCGNLSDKVTEEILYELFLQGGPVQRVSIPRDREGKQRTYGFITYKHVDSVMYALRLFDDTMLFNRPIIVSAKNNLELSQTEKDSEEQIRLNEILQLGNQMTIGNVGYPLQIDSFRMTMSNIPLPPVELDRYCSKDDRRSRRAHPYHRKDTAPNYNENHRSRSNHNSSHYDNHFRNSRRDRRTRRY